MTGNLQWKGLMKFVKKYKWHTPYLIKMTITTYNTAFAISNKLPPISKGILFYEISKHLIKHPLHLATFNRPIDIFQYHYHCRPSERSLPIGKIPANSTRSANTPPHANRKSMRENNIYCYNNNNNNNNNSKYHWNPFFVFIVLVKVNNSFIQYYV